MATIWFLKDGEAQLAFPIARKPLEWCVKNIGLRPDNWRLGRKRFVAANVLFSGSGVICAHEGAATRSETTDTNNLRICFCIAGLLLFIGLQTAVT